MFNFEIPSHEVRNQKASCSHCRKCLSISKTVEDRAKITINDNRVGKFSHFLALSINISKTVEDRAKITIND